VTTMANDLSPVVFEPVNRELRTVTTYFPSSDSVAQIVWEASVRPNAQITTGQTLATIRWNSGRSAPIQAPAGCDGRVTYQNGAVQYEFLSIQAQTLLRL